MATAKAKTSKEQLLAEAYALLQKYPERQDEIMGILQQNKVLEDPYYYTSAGKVRKPAKVDNSLTPAQQQRYYTMLDREAAQREKRETETKAERKEIDKKKSEFWEDVEEKSLNPKRFLESEYIRGQRMSKTPMGKAADEILMEYAMEELIDGGKRFQQMSPQEMDQYLSDFEHAPLQVRQAVLEAFPDGIDPEGTARKRKASSQRAGKQQYEREAMPVAQEAPVAMDDEGYLSKIARSFQPQEVPVTTEEEGFTMENPETTEEDDLARIKQIIQQKDSVMYENSPFLSTDKKESKRQQLSLPLESNPARLRRLKNTKSYVR